MFSRSRPRTAILDSSFQCSRGRRDWAFSRLGMAALVAIAYSTVRYLIRGLRCLPHLPGLLDDNIYEEAEKREVKAGVEALFIDP